MLVALTQGENTVTPRLAEDADLRGRLSAVERRSEPRLEVEDVTEIVESVLASLSGELSVAELQVYREIEQIARMIQSGRQEIAEIRPHDISEHIPMANDELDAVVSATAEATGTILDVAEVMEKLIPEMPPEMGKTVGEAVTRIYEACNFQDVTGQRITKVVKTLRYIEGKVDALLAAFGEHGPRGVRAVAPAAAASGDDSHLMNGPQLPAKANTQEDIDALLAELDRQ
jgi:chemotaxis protein CheZ